MSPLPRPAFCGSAAQVAADGHTRHWRVPFGRVPLACRQWEVPEDIVFKSDERRPWTRFGTGGTPVAPGGCATPAFGRGNERAGPDSIRPILGAACLSSLV